MNYQVVKYNNRQWAIYCRESRTYIFPSGNKYSYQNKKECEVRAMQLNRGK